MLLTGLGATGCATGVTGSPRDVGPEGANVGGRIVSDAGGTAEYWIQYGPTTAYGSSSPHQTIAAAPPNQLVDVSVELGGLQRSTTYHYRLCAQDSQQRGGPGCGPDRRFTTQAVGCGETVDADVRLTGDLQCFTGPGLTVGADGIDIDLAGHGILGTIASGGGGPAGVANPSGYDDLTVHDGAISGLGAMFVADGASRNRLIDVDGRAAGTAVTFNGGTENEVRRSDLFGRTAALSVANSGAFVVADSDLDGFFSGGLVLTGDDARVLRNRVLHSGDEFPVARGIEVSGSRARIVDNRVQGAFSLGGILVAGSDNRLVDNQVSGASAPDLSPAPDSLGDGIFVSAFSAGVVLRRNTANANDGDGIEVRAGSARLEDNAANGNGDWGIDAAAGVTDLGGNSAAGNGQPAQCRNLFCG